jgi:hypothetical protein
MLPTMTQPSPKPARSPLSALTPLVLGVVAGCAAFAGYYWWSHNRSAEAAAATGDADAPKPAADECAIARAALGAIHAAGADQAWRKAAGGGPISLLAASKVINPADVPGYTDDEADDLRGKTAVDWRGCAGLSAFVTGLGWKSPVAADDGVAALAPGRPGMSKTGDEARVYEAFLAPQPDSGVLLRAAGPWLATLRRGQNGGWEVVSTDDLNGARP